MFLKLISLLVKNLASNRNQKFDDLLIEITNDFKSNEGSNFFDIFRDKVQSSSKDLRYFHEYGSNVDDIISSLEKETEDSINRVRNPAKQDRSIWCC